MNRDRALTMGIGALAALLISMPLEWIGPQSSANAFTSVRDVDGSAFGASVGLFVSVPLWLIVALGLVGCVYALLNQLHVVASGRILPSLLVAVSGVHIVAVIVGGLGSDKMEAGLGAYVALIGIGLAAVLALKPAGTRRSTE